MQARKSGIIPNGWACENCGLPFYDKTTAEECCKSSTTTIKRTTELKIGDYIKLFEGCYGNGTVVEASKQFDTITIRRPFILSQDFPHIGWEDVVFYRSDSYKHKVFRD